jgi:hypothetical protein
MVPLQLNVDVKLVPSGFSSVTVVHESVLLASLAVTSWPDVPLNVMFAFCPGTVMLAANAPPLIVTEPLTSTTLKSVVVVWPVPVPEGSITIVYVPLTGSCCGSTKMLAPHVNVLDNCVPSGFRICSVQQELNVELLVTLTRCVVEPVNVSRATWPGVPIGETTDEPPTVID